MVWLCWKGHTHKRTHTQKDTHTQAWTHARTHTHTHMNARTHTRTHAHIRIKGYYLLNCTHVRMKGCSLLNCISTVQLHSTSRTWRKTTFPKHTTATTLLPPSVLSLLASLENGIARFNELPRQWVWPPLLLQVTEWMRWKCWCWQVGTVQLWQSSHWSTICWLCWTMAVGEGWDRIVTKASYPSSLRWTLFLATWEMTVSLEWDRDQDCGLALPRAVSMASGLPPRDNKQSKLIHISQTMKACSYSKWVKKSLYYQNEVSWKKQVFALRLSFFYYLFDSYRFLLMYFASIEFQSMIDLICTLAD